MLQKTFQNLGSPIIREIGEGFRFKFSLVINDAVINYDEENRSNVLIVQSIWDSGNVVLETIEMPEIGIEVSINQ